VKEGTVGDGGGSGHRVVYNLRFTTSEIEGELCAEWE